MPTQIITRANMHDLQFAVMHGKPEDVNDILDMGTVNINSTVCGMTALSLTLYREKTHLFKLLMCHKCTQNKLDINKPSKDDKHRLEPPLVTACRLGDKEAVKLLVKYGVDLEGTDNFNHASLWMATRQRYTDLVLFLLQHGASVNPSQIWSRSPLFFAIKYSSKRTEIAKILIYYGACLYIEKSASMLYWSIVQGNVNLTKLIVDAGYHVSSDEKIRQEYLEDTLTRNSILLEWLKQELFEPPSLQRQCRAVLRRHISDTHKGVHFVKRLGELPLPKSIIEYLALFMHRDKECTL